MCVHVRLDGRAGVQKHVNTAMHASTSACRLLARVMHIGGLNVCSEQRKLVHNFGPGWKEARGRFDLHEEGASSPSFHIVTSLHASAAVVTTTFVVIIVVVVIVRAIVVVVVAVVAARFDLDRPLVTR